MQATFYSHKDLEHIGHTLEKTTEIVNRARDTYCPELVTLLDNRLNACHMLLEKLRSDLSILSPELEPLYEQLISILRSVAAANTKSEVLSFEKCKLCII
jgi:hypothetical protein